MGSDDPSPKLASAGQRIGNGIFDLIVTVPLVFAVGAAAGWGTIHHRGMVVFVHMGGGPLVGATAVVFLLFTLMEYWTAKTPGKYLTGTRTRFLGGDPLSLRASLVRNLLRFVDCFLFGLPGILVILATERNQRVGDLLAGTSVFTG